MDPLADALADPGSSPAQLRALLRAELEHGQQELARKRSGYGRPVTVAVAPGGTAVAPVAPQLRADPAAVDDRAWTLVAALVGALVAAGADAESLTAGAQDGYLALHLVNADAELVALAFEEQLAGVDRLRARALVVPELAATDLRAPIGDGHPLLAAARIAALGGMPADPASVEQFEELLFDRAGEEATRPHDDPDPARRIARRILQRLNGMGKWGGYHTEFTHLARGFAGNDRKLAEAVGEALLDDGLLQSKPSVGQRHVFLNPRRAADIHALIERGVLPPTLRLP
ncbi:MAG: hypothetical protein E6G41_13045 [Actinobacteria bacterium]|nr:MAG: hypothetical protein E6G41_13045 [Actinomycetota bacterium]